MPTVYNFETRDIVTGVWSRSQRKATLDSIHKMCGRAIDDSDEEVNLVDSNGFKMLHEGRNAFGEITQEYMEPAEDHHLAAKPVYRDKRYGR